MNYKRRKKDIKSRHSAIVGLEGRSSTAVVVVVVLARKQKKFSVTIYHALRSESIGSSTNTHTQTDTLENLVCLSSILML